MNHGTGMRARLHDHVALDEIELYAEVLIAVADTDHRLSPNELDRVLGLSRNVEEETGSPPRPPEPRAEKNEVRPAHPSVPAPAPAPAPAPGDHPPPTHWVLHWPAGGVRTLRPPHEASPYRFVPWRF